MHHFELNCCRICLGTHNLKDIFADNVVPTITDKIMYCASVQLSPQDSLPSKICNKCILYLDVAYLFKTVCEWVDSKLRQESADKNELVNSEQTAQTNDLIETVSATVSECSNIQSSNLSKRRNHVMHLIQTHLRQGNLNTLLLKTASGNLMTSLHSYHKEVLQSCNHLIVQNRISSNLQPVDLISESDLLRHTNIQDLFVLCNNKINTFANVLLSDDDSECNYNERANTRNELCAEGFKSKLENKIFVNRTNPNNAMNIDINTKFNGSESNDKNFGKNKSVDVYSEITAKVNSIDFKEQQSNNMKNNLTDNRADLISAKTNSESKNYTCSNENDLRDEENEDEWAIDYEKCSNKSDSQNQDNCSVISEGSLINDASEAIVDSQDLIDEFRLSFDGGSNEIKINKINPDHYTFNNEIDVDKCKYIEEINDEKVKLINDERSLLVTNKKISLFVENDVVERKVIVEKRILIDDSITNKEIVFQCQRHHDNFYNDQSVFLNNEDPLLHNEKPESELRNLEIINNANEDCLNNTVCLKNDDMGRDNINIQFNENKVDSKPAFLKNILLQDFENFEKEKLNNHQELNNISSENDNILEISPNSRSISAKSENRVGRHIAKKNAGQPPKRYSPAPPVTLKTTLNQNMEQKHTKDDASIAEKHREMDELTEKTVNIENMESILDQQYILESDLSMPEPIFEETVVTESFCFVDNEIDISIAAPDEGHTEDQPIKNAARVKRGLKKRQKGNKIKKGTRRVKQHHKKMNVSTNPTVTEWTQLELNNAKNIESSSDNKNNIRFKRKNTKNCCHVYDNGNHSSNKDSEDECMANEEDLDYSASNDNNSEDDYGKPQNTFVKRKFISTKRSRYKQTSMDTTCKICNKSFPFPSHLRRHLTAHIGVKRFACKYCNKQFLHSYNLSVHVRSHTGDFPLTCNICHRGFASPSVLERHKRSHTGETPYQCRYCLQLFSHASSLNMHEKMHLSRPSFTCDVCFKVFSYKSSLTAHKKGHSGLKAHSCGVCHKRFTRRTSVLRHMSCHTEAKKFKCRTCSDVFTSQSSLVKHHKVHSKV